MEDFNWQLAILTAGVFSNASLVIVFHHLKLHFMSITLSVPLLYWVTNWMNYIINIL